MRFAAAREMGMIACRHCGTVWRGVADGAPCGRCRARLYSRKPDSINRTWALLLTACILYLPANLLPVMTTRSLFGTQEDTILSGVIHFWDSATGRSPRSSSSPASSCRCSSSPR